MPTLPADEDYARALLSILGGRNLRPLQSLRRDEVQSTFLARNMGRPYDFEAALDYAISRGWVWAGFDYIRLTGRGDEEMQTIWLGSDVWREPPPRKPPAPSPTALKTRA
ncbi:MAG: hypothetical protein JO223_07515 [Hyphomicrobiales bacterium]|nr:hypothetical protein [Hyphomicrobiales bacterium]